MAAKWFRLDNASNIFLATQNEVDTKVFRLAAEMKDDVDPRILQNALDNVYENYPLFHCVLRRGIFWYYLEESDLQPRVRYETETPCTPIYQSGHRNLLFRVLYQNNYIFLEVFHGLTDGTGALWFFEDILAEYTRIRYINEESIIQDREKNDIEDSFNRYFNKKKQDIKLDPSTESLNEIYEENDMEEEKIPEDEEKEVAGKIYRIKGESTPDYRPRVISIDMDVKSCLNLSRAKGVSLTIYMTALYLLSVYETSPKEEEETTISISIPINLREFFPSISVRNFFSTTILFYVFKQNETNTIDDICREIDRQFKKQLDKDALEKRLQRYIEFERNPIARMIPRFAKDFILQMVNKRNNRKITVAMSNLGLVRLPDKIGDMVDKISFYTSVIRPQFCMMSYGNNLNITFTSPFTETTLQQKFVKYLTDQGVDITVDANKVTSKELDVG